MSVLCIDNNRDLVDRLVVSPIPLPRRNGSPAKIVSSRRSNGLRPSRALRELALAPRRCNLPLEQRQSRLAVRRPPRRRDSNALCGQAVAAGAPTLAIDPSGPGRSHVRRAVVDARRRAAVHGGAQPRECDGDVVGRRESRSLLYTATSPKGSPSKAFEASRSRHRQMPRGGDVALSERSEFAQMPGLADGHFTGSPRGLAGRVLRRAERRGAAHGRATEVRRRSA